MFRKFISLEWKSFLRSASFKTNLFLKIIMFLGALYFMAVFTFLGVGVYYLLEEMGMEPFSTVNRYLLFYLLLDLMFRFFLQKTPVMNIKPLMSMNIRKNSIVKYTLGKSIISFFNWIHLFFLLPFSIVLIREGFEVVHVFTWFIAILSFIFCNNFLNILSDNNRRLLFFLSAVLVILAGFTYLDTFDVTVYSEEFFTLFYASSIWLPFPVLFLALLAKITFSFFRKNLYLDAGLRIKMRQVSSENFSWLNQFGTLGTFLKNDIKLIKRNKRSRTTVLISVLFIFYGLLFFTGAIEAYEGPVWRIFAGIFVTGGFLFTFGQFVPSWDSSYYPLMMSQNIQYRDYLNSKWWLMVIATIITTILSSFYLYFGWEVYLAIVVGAIFNIGVNSHLVLWAGAYIKTPIDLTQTKNVFGNKQAFNAKTLLLSIPKLILPLILYALGHYLFNPVTGYALVACAGVLGFAFKDKVFTIIEKIYKTEKYKTLAAYKEKN